jgi:hypothetical protein
MDIIQISKFSILNFKKYKSKSCEVFDLNSMVIDIEVYECININQKMLFSIYVHLYHCFIICADKASKRYKIVPHKKRGYREWEVPGSSNCCKGRG